MLRFTVCILLFFCSASAFGQSSDRVIIKYDPLFWKDQLKLSSAQSNKIKEINTEYYEKMVKIASSSHSSGSNARTKVDEVLEQRSSEIWNTFHPRQKRKWMKMWSEVNNG